jgi:hypothetical protein
MVWARFIIGETSEQEVNLAHAAPLMPSMLDAPQRRALSTLGLLKFAIVGSVVSLLMILVGLIWLGVRREFEVSRMSPEEAGDMVVRGWRGRPRVWFGAGHDELLRRNR